MGIMLVNITAACMIRRTYCGRPHVTVNVALFCRYFCVGFFSRDQNLNLLIVPYVPYLSVRGRMFLCDCVKPVCMRNRIHYFFLSLIRVTQSLAHYAYEDTRFDVSQNCGLIDLVRNCAVAN